MNTARVIVGLGVCAAVCVAIYVSHSAWALLGLMFVPHISAVINLEGQDGNDKIKH
jgi:hypothetical protein